MRLCLGERSFEMGSTIYDGSVKGQLERMRETLSNLRPPAGGPELNAISTCADCWWLKAES